MPRLRLGIRTTPPAGRTSDPGEGSPLATLRTLRRPAGAELVWQPRFAYGSAFVILLALTVVSMPLWIVLYRLVGTTGAPLRDVLALCMMLLGGFLAAAAAWTVIVEMRGRVRMVDTLARTGDREPALAPAAPELPMLDAPLDRLAVHPIGAPPSLPSMAVSSISLSSRVEAHQVGAPATLEASSKLLASFSGVLRSFGQLWAQVALLAVALTLFVGATILSF